MLGHSVLSFSLKDETIFLKTLGGGDKLPVVLSLLIVGCNLLPILTVDGEFSADKMDYGTIPFLSLYSEGEIPKPKIRNYHPIHD